MRKSTTTNTFQEGLVSDFHPISTPNNVLVNALNATLTTMNGNENVLQNDMGNGRVETAYLPEGYVPLGTCSLGGIIYIVSYNPLIDKCQIGSFPSPERNITSDEIGDPNAQLNCISFYDTEKEIENLLKSRTQLIMLSSFSLTPGDKFQISYSGGTDEDLSAKTSDKLNDDDLPKYLKLNVVSVEDSGKTIDLTGNLVWNNGYYILKDASMVSGEKVTLSEYRNLVSSNYQVFQSKTSGKLAILAKLECIDTFDVSWDAVKVDGKWNIYFYTNWTYENELSYNKINLYGLYVTWEEKKQEITIGNYPYLGGGKGITDIKQCDGITFENPGYIEDINNIIDSEGTSINYPTRSGVERKNDGTDNQFLITEPITLGTTDDKDITVSVYPTMPFGIMQWFKTDFVINPSKLGSGLINLIAYKYYVEKETITLQIGLEAYPEKNKKIQGVTISWCELTKGSETEGLLADIYKAKIDDDRVNDGTLEFYNADTQEWEKDSTEGTSTFTFPSVESENQLSWTAASYSGYKTFTISQDNITSDRVYLVEISINYDGKMIKYYRLLFNSTIFNSYYFKSGYNDFKNISLNEVIKNNVDYTLNTKTTVSEATLDWWEDTKVIEEPSILLSEADTNVEATIAENYKASAISTLTASCPSILTINAKFTEVEKGTLKHTNEAAATSIKYKSQIAQGTLEAAKYTINNAELANVTIGTKVTPTIDNGALKINEINYLATFPVLINQDQITNPNVAYELKHITTPYPTWMVLKGWDKGSQMTLYCPPTGLNEGAQGAITNDEAGDDVAQSGTINNYSQTYNYLSEQLDAHSVIFMPIICSRSNGSKKECPQLIWPDSSSKLITHYNKGDKKVTWKDVIGWNDCVATFAYAMKNTNGEVVLIMLHSKTPALCKFFSFDENGKKGTAEIGGSNNHSDVNWNHDVVAQLPSPLYTNSNSEINLAIPNYLGPFQGYYIPETPTSSKQMYQWSVIQYYDDFTDTIECSFNDMPISKTVSINGFGLTSGKETIKNLYYVDADKVSKSFTINLNIIISDIINAWIAKVDTPLIILPTKEYKTQAELPLDNRHVYNYNGEDLSGLYKFKAAENALPNPKKDSTACSPNVTFLVQNGLLRISSNSLQYDTLHMDCEDQQIYVSNFYYVVI